MKKCLIIGAGQLGSRHLQGIVKYRYPLVLYVLDPSEESLRIAQIREKEISHTHQVFYTQRWEELPNYFELVVIATSANIREHVLHKLLSKYKVDFLILEKVLFQNLESYERVQDLLIYHGVVAHVNHSRRMFELYKNLRKDLKLNTQCVFNVFGGNWGLGCNALHYLDLFVYLTGSKLTNVDVSLVDGNLVESSRAGFVEFTGTVRGRLSDGSYFNITSLPSDPSPITVSIFNNEQRFIIHEGAVFELYQFDQNNFFNCKIETFKVPYQSELSTVILHDVFEKNNCLLPTYEESVSTHVLFVNELLNKYNSITGKQSSILPIT